MEYSWDDDDLETKLWARPEFSIVDHLRKLVLRDVLAYGKESILDSGCDYRFSVKVGLLEGNKLLFNDIVSIDGFI